MADINLDEKPSTGLQRAMNRGGTATKGGVTKKYAPSAYEGDTPILQRPNMGGTMTRNGVVTKVAPGAPTALPTISTTGLARPNRGGAIVAPKESTVDVGIYNENNGGGTTVKGETLSRIPPQAPRNPSMNAGGTASTSTGLQRTYAPSPYSPPSGAPVATPTTTAAPQTESANPLTGSGNAQPEDTTDALKPSGDFGTASLAPTGFSQRGLSVPRGSDAIPGTGSRLSAPKFGAAPNSSYGKFQRRVFGGRVA